MIKKNLKKKLSHLLVAGTLFSSPLLFEESSAMADESASTERKLMLDFTNPLDDFEANSKLKYSLDQLSGAGIDYLSNKAGSDFGLFKRIGVWSSKTYFSGTWELTSHEGGHTREGRRYGKYDSDFKFKSFTNFSENFPKEFRYYPTDEQLIKERIAGLNQNEHNSYVLFKNNLHNLSSDNASSFLLAKFWDVGYNILEKEPDESDDIKEYIRLLNKKGIKKDKKSDLNQSLIADLFSMQTWDSARAVFNYLKTDRKSIKPTTFRIKGVEFTPPLVNHYRTPDGSLFYFTSFINSNSNNPVEASIGTDVNFIGDGKVNSLMLGVKYYGFKFGNNKRAPKLNPFVSFDFKNKGYSIGTDISIPIKDGLELTGKYEYNKDHILENTVKGKNNGSRVRIGFSYGF